jgi:hypothetical protein
MRGNGRQWAAIKSQLSGNQESINEAAIKRQLSGNQESIERQSRGN